MITFVQRVNRVPLVTFFVLAYLISWCLWLTLVLLGLDIRTPAGSVINVLAIAGPSLSALIVTSITSGPSGVRQLLARLSPAGTHLTWYLAALLLPFAIMLIALIISYVMMSPPPTTAGFGVLSALVPEFIRVFFFGGPLGEEIGWRGYALPRLLQGNSPFKASLLLGVIWGFWHAPIYAVSGTGQNEMVRSGGPVIMLFLAFVVWTIGLSVLFTWLYKLTNGNLLLLILFHTAINTAAYLPSLIGLQNSPVVMMNAGLTWVVAVIVSRTRQFRMTSSEVSPPSK